MGIAVDHGWCLALLLLCLPASLGRGVTWQGVSSLVIVPADAASHVLDVVLRLCAAGAVAGIVLGLAGLHRSQTSILRVGSGAHIVVVLDRSLSMDEPFARTGEKARLSKTAAAAALITDLFDRRPHDEFGLVAFSTQPIPVMPLTFHREAMAAALAAMRQKALANTEIGGGLATGLAMFAQDTEDAAHVLLFVSDGAGLIPDATQDYLRNEAVQARAHIYYLYLRAGDDPALNESLSAGLDSTRPAALDLFFRSLGVPYRGFEARDPGAASAAAHMIDTLENRRATYREPVARQDYDGACYAAASLCLALVLLSRLAERDVAVPVGARRS